MEIRLNGKPADIGDDTTLAMLVEQQRLGEVRYAIEVNEEIIPRSEHASYRLNAGDKVEIVTAIGGG